MKEYIVQAYAEETIRSFDEHGAPELVRCKDCHYGIRNSKDDIFCIKAIYTDKYKKPNWFCADGERK